MNYYAPFMQPINFNPNMPNGMPGQNYIPQGQQQNSSLQCHNDSTMIWVLGKNEAESYPVAPNCQVVLWDKNAPTIYVKSMSANGIPNMRTLDFTERTETSQNLPVNDNVKYVAIDDFNALKAEFEDLKKSINNLNIQTKSRN